MTTPESRTADINGLRMHWLEAGSGPLVILCHGFPELSWSWRKQIAALAAAGYRAVAPDMRGYGGTDAPSDVAAYTIFHLTGDILGLLDHLGEHQAVVVGHDWGAPVAWHCGLFRPDRFRAVAGLSVPYQPRGAISLPDMMKKLGLHRFYMLHFQEPGVAEAELEADPYQTQLRLFWSASGGGVAQGAGWPAVVPPGKTLLEVCAAPASLPAWLSEEDLRRYAENFRRSGYRGGLNWYRNLHRNWELGAPFAGAPITVPTLFVAGSLDGVIRMPGMDKAVEALPKVCLRHRGTHIVPGAGHWVQQEMPEPVNKALLEFLAGL